MVDRGQYRKGKCDVEKKRQILLLVFECLYLVLEHVFNLSNSVRNLLYANVGIHDSNMDHIDSNITVSTETEPC